MPPVRASRVRALGCRPQRSRKAPLGVYGATVDVDAAYRWALMARFAGHQGGPVLVERIATLLPVDRRSRAESRFTAGELPLCQTTRASQAMVLGRRRAKLSIRSKECEGGR